MRKNVVHFIQSLWPAGVEIWLLRLVDHLNPEEFNIHIVVQNNIKFALEKEFEEKGVKIHRCSGAPNLFKFSINFFNLSRAIGKIDVMHSHVHHSSGIVLFLSWIIGIKTRIAHCHNDTRIKRVTDGFLHKVYNETTELLIRFFASHRIAVSKDAAFDLFKNAPGVIIMPCGIDISEFTPPLPDAKYLPEALQLFQQDKVIMHVGRFTSQKNHAFLIELFKDIHDHNNTTILCLAGEGELRQEIEIKAKDLGLQNCVRFLGIRRDIPQLLRLIAHVFVFPSLYEGLGVSVIEAQAAGVPCVISDRIPEIAIVVESLVTRISLDESIEVWRNAVLEALGKPKFDPNRALLQIENSDFNVKHNARTLENIYERN